MSTRTSPCAWPRGAAPRGGTAGGGPGACFAASPPATSVLSSASRCIATSACSGGWAWASASPPWRTTRASSPPPRTAGAACGSSPGSASACPCPCGPGPCPARRRRPWGSARPPRPSPGPACGDDTGRLVAGVRRDATGRTSSDPAQGAGSGCRRPPYRVGTRPVPQSRGRAGSGQSVEPGRCRPQHVGVLDLTPTACSTCMISYRLARSRVVESRVPGRGLLHASNAGSAVTLCPCRGAARLDSQLTAQTVATCTHRLAVHDAPF
mmetsp:Transcript_7719/g.26271  ORF Transcript_7719/g.26271 Transcript_7719/m.26271 type:complete len:267 (+) Transcript_7719:576-1376(+)